jgi:hypothetical protein
VLTWCPKDNLVRNLLGALKSKSAPVNLQVFDTQLQTDGTVLVKLAPKNV